MKEEVEQRQTKTLREGNFWTKYVGTVGKKKDNIPSGTGIGTRTKGNEDVGKGVRVEISKREGEGGNKRNEGKEWK